MFLILICILILIDSLLYFITIGKGGLKEFV